MTPPRTFHVPARTIAVLAIGALLAAVVVLFLSAGASAASGAMTVNGWTYHPHTGILTAADDAWNRNDTPGTVTAKVWKWDPGQHEVIREKSWTNKRPVRIELGRQPYRAAMCQWDVVLVSRDGQRTWLAGKKWSCNPAPTSTTTTTSPPTTTTSTSSTTTSPTTEPTTSTTTSPTSGTTTTTTTAPTTSTTTEPTWTPPPSSTTTSLPTSSTTSTATSSSPPTGKTSSTTAPGTSGPPSTPPSVPSEPTPLPSTGGNAWTWPVTLGGFVALVLGVLITAASGRKTGKYRR